MMNGIFAIAIVWLLAGCAAQQLKFDTLGEGDKLRFMACRHDVAQHICPDDPDSDCAIRAAEMYVAEDPAARRRWLADYGCSEDKIRQAERAVEEGERGSLMSK